MSLLKMARFLEINRSVDGVRRPARWFELPAWRGASQEGAARGRSPMTVTSVLAGSRLGRAGRRGSGSPEF